MTKAELIERSGRRQPMDLLRWRGEDHQPLMINELPGLRRDQVITSDPTLWRYRAAFPVWIERPVSLGEGMTPLVAAEIDGAEVLLKCDHLNPTGSFKDRGVTLMISAVVQERAASGQRDGRRVLEDSSGNGGSSFAAYAAAAGLRARVLVPDGTSPAKMVATRAYGAEVFVVPGNRDATSAEALRQAAQLDYVSHAWHPLFLQGVKTQAYEIWEQLGFQAPDVVIMVAGGGSQVIGHDLAWHELLRAGSIDRVPRLAMVQPAACAPLVAAHQSGHDRVSPASWQPTMAEGTAIGRPVRDVEALAALRRCDGLSVACSEEAIAQATRDLCRLGHYVEPTSADALAGYRALRISGELDTEGTTVMVLTGSGHKAAGRMAELFG